MIYEHQQKAIAYITDKLQSNPEVKALLISGSIAHGFNDERSDVDINIVVSDAFYEEKRLANALTYWESAADFYDGGYFDGKYITLEYLNQVAERGNEPTRFALHDAMIAFDKTGNVAACLEKIGAYNFGSNAIRFAAQLEAWKWYCDEAVKKNNKYLLDMSVTKLILFAGRLILLDNRMLFPYHKWFIKVLEGAPDKPPELMRLINRLLDDKSPENITRFYEAVKSYKDWTGGQEYSWSSYFLHDIETVWMRGDEFVENL